MAYQADGLGWALRILGECIAHSFWIIGGVYAVLFLYELHRLVREKRKAGP